MMSDHLLSADFDRRKKKEAKVWGGGGELKERKSKDKVFVICLLKSWK